MKKASSRPPAHSGAPSRAHNTATSKGVGYYHTPHPGTGSLGKAIKSLEGSSKTGALSGNDWNGKPG